MHDLATNASDNLTALALVITSMASLVAAVSSWSARGHARRAEHTAGQVVERTSEISGQLDRHYDRVEGTYSGFQKTVETLTGALLQATKNNGPKEA